VEIRSKLGQITKWTNAQSKLAKGLYTVILETLNLINADLDNQQLSFLEVKVDMNGRHVTCDRARKSTLLPMLTEGTSIEFAQSIILKFRRVGPHWTSEAKTLYHLEALLSLWMYSFIYRQEPKIKYSENLPTLGTYLTWFYPEQKLLWDFLMIIGHEEQMNALKEMCNMDQTSTQNIVKIAKRIQFQSKDYPRDYVPVDISTGWKGRDRSSRMSSFDNEGKEAQNIIYVPREHVFGREHDGDGEEHKKRNPSSSSSSNSLPPGPLYAYKYPSAPGMNLLRSDLTF